MQLPCRGSANGSRAQDGLGQGQQPSSCCSPKRCAAQQALLVKCPHCSAGFSQVNAHQTIQELGNTGKSVDVWKLRKGRVLIPIAPRLKGLKCKWLVGMGWIAAHLAVALWADIPVEWQCTAQISLRIKDQSVGPGGVRHEERN